MIQNYLKTAIRYLIRNKLQSFINILGLAIGIASTILLVIYIKHELSFDTFHDDSDKIARVISKSIRSGGHEVIFPVTLYEVADLTKKKLPEVKSATHLFRANNFEVSLEQEKKGFFKGVYVGHGFFDVFSFKLLKGDRETSLGEPNKIVLTQSMAKQIFKEDDPIGRTLQFNEDEYTVSGIMEDFPPNSHLKFDYLITIHSLDQDWLSQMGNDFNTYFRFNGSINEDLKNKAVKVVSAYVNEMFEPHGIKYEHFLQPLEDIHLHSDYNFDMSETGSIQYIYIFSILAVFILGIAILNYINLFTASSQKRLKEVGIRKVSGAFRRMLMRQFLGESIMISFVSFLIAMLLVESFIQDFSYLVSADLRFDYSGNILLLVGFFSMSLLVGAISGIYPALFVSRQDPITILRGELSRGKKGNFFKVLIVFVQFSIAIALLAALIILYAQVNYMKHKDLGFDKEQVVYLSALSPKVKSGYQTLKDELLKSPSIEAVTASQSVPGYNRSGMVIRLAEWPEEQAIPCRENRVQPDYVKTYGIEMLQGRDFSGDLASDKKGFILNEEAVKVLGLENPLGEEIVVWRTSGIVQGVMKNFHFRSMHQEIEPLVLSNNVNWFASISVRLAKGQIDDGLEYMKRVLEEYDPDYTFRYNFIDQDFERMYKREEKSNLLILIASVLAIFIAMLGLFALTAFSVNQRTKEIGIRKALGSKESEILILLLKDYLKWVLLAAVPGIPLAYIFTKQWLENFAYSIKPELWMFVLALLIALLIAVVTVISIAIKHSRANPVDSLRYE